METTAACQGCRACRDRKGQPMPCLEHALEGKTGLSRMWAGYRWAVRAEFTEEDREFVQQW
jgi:hypothetical protein